MTNFPVQNSVTNVLYFNTRVPWEINYFFNPLDFCFHLPEEGNILLFFYFKHII